MVLSQMLEQARQKGGGMLAIVVHTGDEGSPSPLQTAKGGFLLADVTAHGYDSNPMILPGDLGQYSAAVIVGGIIDKHDLPGKLVQSILQVSI